MVVLKKVFRLFRLGLLGFALLIGLIWMCNAWITHSSETFTFSDVDSIPKHKVGLLLGTGKHVGISHLNKYYTYRIKAAAELFKAGKVDYLLVSGDNHTKGYNEPEDMQQDLISAGVPANFIILDYAGFRTFDSVIRAKKVFGESEITIISQQFHNERAIFIAQKHGISATGYNAQDVTSRYGYKTKMREFLARVKVFLDLYLLGTKPKFLGDPIAIG